ncbi:SDR family NAD(P)-dependent oxidoreductase [Terricaulis silvestris]|uniref:Levodione reductase n=1 Tax=Terricaulis silvestris TaxID=2686094 RepID=A0A6I6MW40_9CAUL|nr:SDR family oxidoreductase [Terricaulis silvestris]QGZ95842.1 Levodione reductase [Terricaulis silvestris]
MDLDRLNAVALITGAATGIGAALARDIAGRAEGGLILVDSDEAALAALADKIEASTAAPERISTLAFDVSDPDRWAQATEFVKAQYGRVDWALVRSVEAASAEESDLVDWGRVMPTSLDGVLNSLRAVMPLMRSNFQGGAIVVSAPAASIKLDKGGGFAPKAGLLHLIQTAAQQAAPHPIRVNAIAQGAGDAAPWNGLPLFQKLAQDAGGARAAFEKIAALAPPLGRYAATDDITKLIVMLLSDDNPMTGATLVAEGGYTLS